MTTIADRSGASIRESAHHGSLIGSTPAAQADLAAHLNAHGALPAFSSRELIALAADAGLTGHGGAGFPLHRKLEAVLAARGRPIVIGNGAEGEPASAKDRWLLSCRPHLVLDGLNLVGRSVRATDAILYINGRVPRSALAVAIAERRRLDPVAVSLNVAPDAFIAGEESAVVNRLGGGAAIPRSKPPRVVERGLRGRPTLVSNVETLALLALIARRGVGWFRSTGTKDSPGSMLFTVSGAVSLPGIVEAAHGTLLSDVLTGAGGPARRLQAVLIGGYHGSWLTADEAGSARMSRADLQKFGATAGAGVVVAIAEGSCGLVEVSRVMSYLARESAGQCGPCLNGLPRIAEQLRTLTFHSSDKHTVAELTRLGGLVTGRGACHHPDGSVRFLQSALRVFKHEVDLHLLGLCSRTTDEPVLPVSGDNRAADGFLR